MKSTTAFSLLFLSISQLTGCVFSPGQNLSVSGKKVISAEEANYQLDKRVEIFPLTPEWIEKLRPPVSKSQANPNLDKQIKNWEYRIGAGDILTVTVWDHPELTTPAGQYRSASDTGNWVNADGTLFIPMSVNCGWQEKRFHRYVKRLRLDWIASLRVRRWTSA